jgi:hypothetical protein
MLKALENLLDAYNLRARLFPVFLALAPLGLAIASWTPINFQLGASLGSLVATLGVATLLQQMARDAGKGKEERLFREWGGRPSVRMLYYAHTTINRQTLARYHAALRRLAPELRIPAHLEEETKNSSEALFAYESCNDLLLSKTRDKEKFGLLVEENMNYGFRRNTWGLKPVGVAASLVGLTVSGGRLLRDSAIQLDLAPAALAGSAASAALLLAWAFIVTPKWVKIAADAYALRLLACCDELEGPSQEAAT